MCHDIENIPTLEAIFEAWAHGAPVNVFVEWMLSHIWITGLSKEDFSTFILILTGPSTVRMLG